MVNKKIVVICLLVVICILAAFTCYLVAEELSSENTLELTGSCSCHVPNSHSNTANHKENVYAYEDSENNLTIVSYNNQSSSGYEIMKNVTNKTLTGSEKVVNGTTVHYNSTSGMYSIFVGCPATYDNVLITSNNVDLLLQVYNSLKFNGKNLNNSTLTYNFTIASNTTTV